MVMMNQEIEKVLEGADLSGAFGSPQSQRVPHFQAAIEPITHFVVQLGVLDRSFCRRRL